MSSGMVTTGRGLTLNLDELIMRAQMPLGQKQPGSTRATKNYTPRPDNNPQVRGYVPRRGEADMPEYVETVNAETAHQVPAPSSFTEDGEARSIADMTGVKVEMTEGIKKKVRQARGQFDDSGAEEESDATLGEIMEQIDDKSKRTNRRKSSS